MSDIMPCSGTSLVDGKLRRYLRQKGLRSGDVLPSEAALSRQLEVSRSSLREVLSRWRLFGAVSTRRKRGMVLERPDPLAGLEQWIDAALLDQGTCRDLYEMRLVLEIGLADLLVERATPGDCDDLAVIVAGELAAPGDVAGFRAADAAFHGTLYRIAGNRTLQRFQGVLAGFFDSALYAGVIRQDPYGDRPGHADLLAALRGRDAPLLRDRMSRHLHIHLDLLDEPQESAHAT